MRVVNGPVLTISAPRCRTPESLVKLMDKMERQACKTACPKQGKKKKKKGTRWKSDVSADPWPEKKEPKKKKGKEKKTSFKSFKSFKKAKKEL